MEFIRQLTTQQYYIPSINEMIIMGYLWKSRPSHQYKVKTCKQFIVVVHQFSYFAVMILH